ncbi:MAG: glycosyltransferase family 4 protein [Phycisphaerales bacterium]|nr:glycosyltransferase family 4 protein [Phycisphaerales bacterium]
MPLAARQTVRVVLTQPTLTKYRVPVFRELAARPGIDLLVVHGEETNMPTAKPDGFRTQLVPLRERVMGSEAFRWHDAQIDFCTKDKADVVLLSWSTRYLSLLPGLIKARWNGVRTVLWGHGYSKAETRLRDRTRATLASLADALLFYNHTAAQMYIDSGYAPPEQLFVALNTIDQAPIRSVRDAWLAEPARLAEFQKANGLEGRPVVLFVSRLQPWNRTDMLIRAAAALRAKHPGLCVAIVGDGPASDPLRALARELRLDDTVKFTGAIYGEDQLAPWFLSAHAFCYPANIGLSLIHALIYGVPVVTSREQRAQNPEIEAFRDGENGLGFPQDDLEGMTAALDRVLSDQAFQRTLSAAARATVEHDYTISKMVDGLEGALRYAAARKR